MAAGGKNTNLEKMLYVEVGRLTEELGKKNDLIQELQKKLRTQEEHNHYLTSRLAGISQADKADTSRLEKMVSDLILEKNQMHDTIQRLEKEVEKSKKSCFNF